MSYLCSKFLKLIIMSKVSGLTTGLTGSAGQWTFYKRLGTTVGKQKKETPSRKRLSDTQLKNNLRWGNLVAFWSATDGRLRNAFERKKSGQTDFNMFMSNNLLGQGIYLTSEMVRARACVVAPYMVSMGSLPTIEVVEAADGRLRTDVRLGERFSLTPATTIGELSRAIVANNPDFAHGDRIVCLAMKQFDNPADGYPHAECSIAFLQIDAYSNAPLSGHPELMTAFADVDGRIGAASPIVGGMTWIHTRRLRSRVAVSTQRLAVTGVPYAAYATPEALATAIASYRRRIAPPLRR